MAILNFRKPGPLEAGERVIREVRNFRIFSLKTLPSYRLELNLPLLAPTSLLVTDWRCLLKVPIVRSWVCLICMWYPGCNPESDPETITAVCSTRGLLGSCLEIRSYDPSRCGRRMQSPELSLRFYLREPDVIEKVILEQMQARECKP